MLRQLSGCLRFAPALLWCVALLWQVVMPLASVANNAAPAPEVKPHFPLEHRLDSSLNMPFWPVGESNAVAVPAATIIPSNAPAPQGAPAINPVLRASSNAIANANLHRGAHDEAKPAPDQYETMLNLASMQQAQRNYAEANRLCVMVMEGNSADPLKRSALLLMALLAQEQNQLARAQQILAQYLKLYPQDPNAPEIYLRQGLLYRQMGAPLLAISKFYAVMTSALTLKFDSVEYYQRLVLHAQTEIADTYHLQGKHAEAAEFFTRLLKLNAPDLNRRKVQFKLLSCMAALEQHATVIALGQEFLVNGPTSPEEPQVRFLIAQALKKQGHNQEALKEVLVLLQTQQQAGVDRQTWRYWQQRAGNEIANRLYEEGDYVNALELYCVLADLDTAPAWQFPIWYQVGLIYERLQQPEKAAAAYGRILSREKDLASDPSPGLKTVSDMAKWRSNFIGWRFRAEQGVTTNAQLRLPSTIATP